MKKLNAFVIVLFMVLINGQSLGQTFTIIENNIIYSQKSVEIKEVKNLTVSCIHNESVFPAYFDVIDVEINYVSEQTTSKSHLSREYKLIYLGPSGLHKGEKYKGIQVKLFLVDYLSYKVLVNKYLYSTFASSLAKSITTQNNGIYFDGIIETIIR